MIGSIALAALGVAAIVLQPARSGALPAGSTQSYPTPGLKDRVVVEVLNAGGRDGDARVVTRALRQQGFDVVTVGNLHDSLGVTVVVSRRGDLALARRVADALGVKQVAAAPDSFRRVDVSVHIGSDYRRSGPLHP